MKRSERVAILTNTAVDRAMEGADLVVHTAAALPLYPAEDIHTTDVEGTRNVLDAALRRGVKRAVHVSSTAVYGIPDHHPLYETDRLEGVGPYGQAKIQAEMVCLEYRAKGLPPTTSRPQETEPTALATGRAIRWAAAPVGCMAATRR